MDLARLGGTEKALSGAGVLLFIFSFLPWFEVGEFGLSFHADAWSVPSGFNDWFPVVLLFGYAIVLALPAFAVAVRIPVLESGANRALIGFVLSAFAVLMFAIQGLTYPGSGFGYTAGPAWAYYISLLIALAAAVLSYLGFTQRGGSFARIGAALQGQSPGGRQGPQVPPQSMYQQQPMYPPYDQPRQQQPYPGQAPYPGPSYPQQQPPTFPQPQPQPYPQPPAQGGGVPPQQNPQQPPYPGSQPQNPQQ